MIQRDQIDSNSNIINTQIDNDDKSHTASKLLPILKKRNSTTISSNTTPTSSLPSIPKNNSDKIQDKNSRSTSPTKGLGIGIRRPSDSILSSIQRNQSSPNENQPQQQQQQQQQKLTVTTSHPALRVSRNSNDSNELETSDDSNSNSSLDIHVNTRLSSMTSTSPSITDTNSYTTPQKLNSNSIIIENEEYDHIESPSDPISKHPDLNHSTSTPSNSSQQRPYITKSYTSTPSLSRTKSSSTLKSASTIGNYNNNNNNANGNYPSTVNIASSSRSSSVSSTPSKNFSSSTINQNNYSSHMSASTNNINNINSANNNTPIRRQLKSRSSMGNLLNSTRSFNNAQSMLSKAEKDKLFDQYESDDEIPDDALVWNVPLTSKSTVSLLNNSKSSGISSFSNSFTSSNQVASTLFSSTLASANQSSASSISSNLINSKSHSFSSNSSSYNNNIHNNHNSNNNNHPLKDPAKSILRRTESNLGSPLIPTPLPGFSNTKFTNYNHTNNYFSNLTVSTTTGVTTTGNASDLSPINTPNLTDENNNQIPPLSSPYPSDPSPTKLNHSKEQLKNSSNLSLTYTHNNDDSDNNDIEQFRTPPLKSSSVMPSNYSQPQTLTVGVPSPNNNNNNRSSLVSTVSSMTPSPSSSPPRVSHISDNEIVNSPLTKLPNVSGYSISNYDSFNDLSPMAQQLSQFYEASVQNHVDFELQQRSNLVSKIPSVDSFQELSKLDDLKLMSQEKLNQFSITRPIWLPPKDKHESLKHENEFKKMMFRQGEIKKIKKSKEIQRERDRMIGDARLKYLCNKPKDELLKNSHLIEIKKLIWRSLIDYKLKYELILKCEIINFKNIIHTVKDEIELLNKYKLITNDNQNDEDNEEEENEILIIESSEFYKFEYYSKDLISILLNKDLNLINKEIMNLIIILNNLILDKDSNELINKFNKNLKKNFKKILNNEFKNRIYNNLSKNINNSNLNSKSNSNNLSSKYSNEDLENDINSLNFNDFFKLISNKKYLSDDIILKIFTLFLIYNDYKICYSFIIVILTNYFNSDWGTLHDLVNNVSSDNGKEYKDNEPLIQIKDQELFWGRIYNLYKKF